MHTANHTNEPAGTSALKTLRITVLAGGPSSEREVSLISGRAVAEALTGAGHDVRLLDIRPEDLTALDVPADVVFPALHGAFGEDGQVQRILEQRGLCYVGCGPEASALAMDKVATKQACAAAGIPTADYDLVTSDDLQPATKDLCRNNSADFVARHGPGPRQTTPRPSTVAPEVRACYRTDPNRWAGRRVVVKPVDQGSSVDIFIVPNMCPLDQALETVVGRYGRAMIEQFVDGPELTVGVFDGQALPVIQIVPAGQDRFYDYQAKYLDDTTQYLVNPPLPAELLQRVQEMSLTVFETVGCRDMARIDWRIEQSTMAPYLLEVNTIPGFTSHSLLPKAAAASGIDFATLCRRLVEMALQRGRRAPVGGSGNGFEARCR